jgi:acetoin utilization deacetylase AcuC-like enzyme
MTLLYSSSRFLDHQTGGHPESPARLVAVTCHLAATELDRKCRRPLWKPVSAERLAGVHSPKYTEKVRQFAAHGGGHIEADTVMGEESFATALFAAGAVCDAVELTLAGEDRQAVCLVRPPGHHALPDAAMGFCLFNNVAIAARMATDELDVDRVLIVDWDVHHGNGTQKTFGRTHGSVSCRFTAGPSTPERAGPTKRGADEAWGRSGICPSKWGSREKTTSSSLPAS